MGKDATSSSAVKAILGLGLVIILIYVGLWLFTKESTTSDELPITPTPVTDKVHLTLVMDNLPVLSSGFYTLTIISDDPTFGSTALDSFVINEKGEMETLTGEPIINNELSVDASVLETSGTISLVVASENPTAQESVLLHGDLQEGLGALEFVGDTLATASGKFILATPSDGLDTNETSGVWFISNNENNEEVAGLTLPSPPDGWIYEAWVVVESQVFSVGQFASVTGQDSFNGYTGDEDVPSYPGEDFLQNPPDSVLFPLDLSIVGTRILVTLEPDFKRTGDESLGVEVLSFTVPDTVQAATAYQLENVLGEFIPSGLVIVRR